MSVIAIVPYLSVEYSSYRTAFVLSSVECASKVALIAALLRSGRPFAKTHHPLA
jgi:hypothetical protein